MSLDACRQFYANFVTANAGVRDSRIERAFAAVERERFLGAGPWQIQTASGYITTDTDDPAVLYQDVLVGLVPEDGINNGQPSLHAKAIGAASPQRGDVVLHVGSGVGYYTAILAHLVRPEGHVHAYEIRADLAGRAATHLAEDDGVTVHPQSALEVALPTANVIYVSAGTTEIPAQWLDALAPGGRLVLPLTPTDRLGCMVLMTRQSEAGYAARVFSPAAFVPCVGAHDKRQSLALAAALDTRSTDTIRSLRRDTTPDETAWCTGEGWWLSTAEPLDT